MKTFTCESCGGTFEDLGENAEMQREAREQFSDVPAEDLAEVCDDCYQRMRDWWLHLPEQEYECQCCHRKETMNVHLAHARGWDVPPAHEITVCPFCPVAHLVLGEPCDHAWTPERYEAESEKMQAEHPEIRQLIELAASKGVSVEEMKAMAVRIMLDKEAKV
jgi:hypothetical protein